MDVVLLDWTRMGQSYCLAGVIHQGGRPRVVRPLPIRARTAPVRNLGWSAFMMNGHSRWEVFEMVGPEPAPAEPPHLEDVWVRGLRPRGRLATPAERRASLEAILTPPGLPFFGASLQTTRTAAYLVPGSGERSLATILVPTARLAFAASQREGTLEPDYRVTLDLPDVGRRTLPVKDHFLLNRAETDSPDPEGRARSLALTVRAMGEVVAVRLGLSRPFGSHPGRGDRFCWLMADGFFSPTDPQP